MVDLASDSTNQRPGFQLTYVSENTYASKTLAHDPALYVVESSMESVTKKSNETYICGAIGSE